MIQNQGVSIQSYMERNIFRQSLIGLIAMGLISVSVTYFLSRYKMTADLEKSAQATAEAFRSRIVEGDIKAVEGQIRNVLNLKSGEEIFVLDKARKRLYRSTPTEELLLSGCGPDGYACFVDYTGPGRIFYPIYFDEAKNTLFGYLYLSKSVQIDWLYVFIIFSVFCLGYVAVLLGLNSVARSSSKRLSAELEDWSQRLRLDPKSRDPLSNAPFAELIPLKRAIEGLTTQIEDYENKAEEKAKLLVLRGVAHDLLSPVSQVQMYLATLEHQATFDECASDTISEIKSSLQKLSALASQVKALNEVSMVAETSDLVERVKVEVEELRKSERIRLKDLRLELQISDRSVSSSLSQTEVSRIIQNLVENAADASEPGAEIRVLVGQDGSHSILAVEDSGHGIPEHLLEKVFEPDFTSKPSTGTGLGLFIVKHICEQKEGTVSLQSKRGEGTRITVLIPQLSYKGGMYAT